MLTISIFSAIILATIIVLNLPVFGKLPSGSRLNSIHHLSNYKDGALQNLSPTPMQPEGVTFFEIFRKYLFGKHPNKVPTRAIVTVKPALDSLPGINSTEIIWFGHSSYLIKAGDKRILVDPVFSSTPSPFSFVGSKAFPGTEFVNAEDFLNIDILVITHDHYDHLDYHSILKIAPNVKAMVTSMGVGSHLERWGISSGKINELGWEQSVTLFNSIKLTAVPARHFTGRKFKRNQTLWSAFVLELPGSKLFLGGDSGYDKHFEKIGNSYGPFDIAILECGQYDEMWPYIHMFPEQTVQAAIDLKAKILMPVHWGKFSLSMHPWNEPIERVTKEAENKQLQIITPRLGETVLLENTHQFEKWWLA